MAQILLFARGVIALLDLWPALTIAVREEWGGSDSAAKKIWLASTLVDEFESRAIYLDSSNEPETKTKTETAVIDPRTATDPPLDQDEVHDLVAQMMADEFDALIEDDSIPRLAGDVVRLWRDVVSAPTLNPAAEVEGGVTTTKVNPEELVAALEAKAKLAGGKVAAQKGADVEIVDDDGEAWMSDDDDDDDDDDDEEESRRVEGMDQDEAPQLVERKQEVVDDDGFTLVQKGGRRR